MLHFPLWPLCRPVFYLPIKPHKSHIGCNLCRPLYWGVKKLLTSSSSLRLPASALLNIPLSLIRPLVPSLRFIFYPRAPLEVPLFSVFTSSSCTIITSMPLQACFSCNPPAHKVCVVKEKHLPISHIYPSSNAVSSCNPHYVHLSLMSEFWPQHLHVLFPQVVLQQQSAEAECRT